MSSSPQLMIEQGVAHLTLNRPAARNALDIPTLKAISAYLEDFAENPAVRVLLIDAVGKSFCAGADLAEWAAAEARGELESYGWTQAAHQMMNQLYLLPKPTIAVIHGGAVGAGMDLALCCDMRIAGTSAHFKAGYTSMAYCPDAGASWHLPRLIGEEQAKRLLFLDELWNAEQALAVGLVGEVCPDTELSTLAQERAARFAAGPTLAFAETKTLIRQSYTRTLAEQLLAEQAAGLRCGRSQDASEALAAIAEKRPPHFTGR